MSYVEVSKAVKVGQTIRCKYPKHGRMNILKWHEGTVEQVGVGPNGTYALVLEPKTRQYRTLRCDKMVDTVLS